MHLIVAKPIFYGDEQNLGHFRVIQWSEATKKLRWTSYLGRQKGEEEKEDKTLMKEMEEMAKKLEKEIGQDMENLQRKFACSNLKEEVEILSRISPTMRESILQEVDALAEDVPLPVKAV